MVAKFSASESSGDDGDGVEVLKNEPYEENDRRGQYTHKIYHLAKFVDLTWLPFFPYPLILYYQGGYLQSIQITNLILV